MCLIDFMEPGTTNILHIYYGTLSKWRCVIQNHLQRMLKSEIALLHDNACTHTVVSVTETIQKF